MKEALDCIEKTPDCMKKATSCTQNKCLDRKVLMLHRIRKQKTQDRLKTLWVGWKKPALGIILR